jgi:hypothetical protein
MLDQLREIQNETGKAIGWSNLSTNWHQYRQSQHLRDYFSYQGRR